MAFKDKMQSRKFMLVILIIILATIGTFCPPILSIFNIKFVILNGAEFVSLIALVIGAYFGANVWQNRAEINTDYPEYLRVKSLRENNSDVTYDEEFEDKENAEA